MRFAVRGETDAGAKVPVGEFRRLIHEGASRLHHQHLFRDGLEVGAEVDRTLEAEDAALGGLDPQMAEQRLIGRLHPVGRDDDLDPADTEQRHGSEVHAGAAEHRPGAGDPAVAEAADLETGEIKDLTPGRFPRYSASGHLLFKDADAATLLAAPFDVEKLELMGAALPVVEGLMSGGVGGQGWPLFAVSQTGTLLYSTDVGGVDTELVWVTRSGEATPVDVGWQFNRGGDTNAGWSLSVESSSSAVCGRSGLSVCSPFPVGVPH